MWGWGQQKGTKNPPFPAQGWVPDPQVVGNANKYIHICMMNEYQNKSPEELRWEDYQMNNQSSQSSWNTSSSWGFNTPSTNNNTGFNWGTSNSTWGNSSPSNPWGNTSSGNSWGNFSLDNPSQTQNSWNNPWNFSLDGNNNQNTNSVWNWGNQNQNNNNSWNWSFGNNNNTNNSLWNWNQNTNTQQQQPAQPLQPPPKPIIASVEGVKVEGESFVFDPFGLDRMNLTLSPVPKPPQTPSTPLTPLQKLQQSPSIKPHQLGSPLPASPAPGPKASPVKFSPLFDAVHHVKVVPRQSLSNSPLLLASPAISRHSRQPSRFDLSSN